MLSALLLPLTAGAGPLSDCAGIESAVERLDCYDELARQGNQAQPDEDVFGRQAEKPDKDIEAISAHIQSVKQSPLGHHIMTLSNGQVWMQNEPGRRRIEAGQDITIRKHRFHYEMEFENIPDIPVRRVE
ncbi:MAG: hypothetical protein HUJ31_16345 [Pseudomonadales bacterium]|nr:hypothetical protein [Pseudomonadales bacterium]